MGVNANFQADFSTFNNAVDSAIVKLADFGKGAEDVEDKLNRMVDKWSGRALIQQASELVVAINKVGGATALTTTEQQKLNAILQEAIAKYKVIGEQVPPEVQKLADQTKALADQSKNAANTVSGELVPGLNSMLAAGAAAFSVGAVVQYVNKLIDTASQLQTLSAQTRISVEDLQVLGGATKTYGISADELGRALFALQSRINGGDQSVASAYAAMGIRLDEIKGKNAYDLFVTTEHGLAQLAGGARDAASVDFYGGKLGAGLAAFSTGADEAIEKSRRLSTVISTDAAKALADYGDELSRSKASIDAFVTNALGPLAQGFNAVTDAAGKGASKWQLAVAWFEDMVGGAGNLTRVMDHANVAFEENAKQTAAAAAAGQQHAAAQQTVVTAVQQRAQAETFLQTMEAQAYVTLTEEQTAYLARLDAIGQLTAQNAERVGINVAQLERYKKGLEDAKKAADDLKKAVADADAIAFDSYNKRIKSLESLTAAGLKAYSFEGQIGQLNALKAAEEDLARSVYAHIDSEKTRMKILEDLAARKTAIDEQRMALEKKKLELTNKAVTDELSAQARIMDAYGQNVDGTTKVVTAQEKLARSMDELHNKKVEGFSQYYQEQELMDQFLRDQEAETKANDDATDALKRKTAATKDGAAATREYAGSITMAVDATRDWHAQLDAIFPAFEKNSAAARNFVNSGMTIGEAAYAAGGGIIHQSISGGFTYRAGGGPVNAGDSYIVGERGPELFVPSSSGAIVPNGGGGGVTVNINGSVLGTPAEIARVVGGAVMSVMRGQGTRFPTA